MNYRYGHTHLKAQDVEATKQWYCSILDGKVTYEGMFRASKEYHLDIGGTCLAIHGELEDELALPVSLHPRFGLDHFGLIVEDMDAAVAELKAKGVHFVEGPWATGEGIRMACIEAPDRVRIELVERGPLNTSDEPMRTDDGSQDLNRRNPR